VVKAGLRQDTKVWRMSPGSRLVAKMISACKRADVLLILLVLLLGGLLLLRYGSMPEPVSMQSVPSPALQPSAQETPAPARQKLPVAGSPVRFLMYNVQNYFVVGEKSRSRYMNRAKSRKSREAVAEVIAAGQPDIVGLIEIGGEKALEDLRGLLEKRGLEYAHAVLVAREGEDRALALLSRFPIVRNDSRADFPLYGRRQRKMLRGVLDATVQLEDGRMFRIVGAHLKSRMGDDAAAAAALRASEAASLAFYLHERMLSMPEMPFLVFGDWNDGPDDASLRLLRHGIAEHSALTRLLPRDSRGEEWTLFYKNARAYYVFDQIFVNSVTRKRRGSRSGCGIVDVPAAGDASDHRALWCELR